MAKRRQSKLRLVANAEPREVDRGQTEILTTELRVRAGGLFSDATLPTFDEDAISDPEVFFALPTLVSLLHEQIEIGNIGQVSNRTGVEPEELKRLLKHITYKDHLSLLKLRLALGIR